MKQKLRTSLVFAPLAIAILFLVLPAGDKTASGLNRAPKIQRATPSIEPERLISYLQYIGADYDAAVENHKIVNKDEYQEMVEFSEAAIEGYISLNRENTARPTYRALQRVRELVGAKASGSEIKILTSKLVRELSTELSVTPYPTHTPDLTAGKKFYEIACAECHGSSGDGQGRSAKALNPPPSNFQNPERMLEATPHQFFNVITFGVQGTAMPSHQQAFTDQQCWDIAFYLMTLRGDFSPELPEQEVGFSIRDLATLSDKQLVQRLATEPRAKVLTSSPDSHWTSVIDYWRQNPPEVNPDEKLNAAQQKLSKSITAYQNGQSDQAVQLALDAYLEGIEPVEPLLSQKAPALVTVVEKEFGQYRRAVRSEAPMTQVTQRYRKLVNIFEEIRSTFGSSEAVTGFAFIQSLTIILREGTEAVLLIALLMTLLVALGHQGLKKYLTAGAVAGIVLGGLTWIAAQRFVVITQFEQETLEGMTSLLAAAVLFCVSFWIIHKSDLQKWKTYIQTKAEKALGTGSGFALAMAAFLVVYREAFETVLFYQALWLRSSVVHSQIISGFILGVAALIVLVFFILKFGLKIPLGPFFGVTGVLLGLLAIVFAGYGVRELQSIGLLNETPLSLNVDLNFLEIHSTLEGLALQSGILLSFLLGWFGLLVDKFRLARQVEPKHATAE
ncbi:MAG: FTR1 family protein [bacterium]